MRDSRAWTVATCGTEKGVKLTMAGEAIKNGSRRSLNWASGNGSGVTGSNSTGRAQYIPVHTIKLSTYH